jgi:hypothetical protein
MTQSRQASSGNFSLAMVQGQSPSLLQQQRDDPLERISEVLRINARRGFFHAMISYRVNPDQDFATKIHDKTHMLNTSSFRQSSNGTRALDSFPWPKAFQRHETVRNSSLRLFQDSFCLKDGNSWEGDGRSNGGGFLGALRLSVVFAPVFSAQTQNGSIVPEGSIGQMIELGRQDKQDNVLLELIVAREFHLLGKKCKSKALLPCSCILPLFRNECVWDASLQLPNIPSVKTNQKALRMMELIGLEALVSAELRDGSLTVADVWVFFCQFQGVKLYDHGSEKYQMEAAAQSIINVVKDVMSEFIFRDNDMNCAQLYELFSFLSALNIPHYTGILASHNITSVQQLSHLFDHGSDKLYHLIAEDCNRLAYDSSLACELTKLRSAAAAASESPISKPLDVRFRNFVDSDASFVTALQSSSFVDILLSKKLLLVVFSVLIAMGATICLVQLLFPNSDDFLAINRFNQNATFFGLAIGIYVVKAIAVLAAHFKSPRSGRYVLAFAVFLWFLLSSWKYIVSVRSAVYDVCQSCSSAEQAMQSDDSVTLSILQLPCWPLVFGPACILIIIKQHLFIPLMLSAFFVVVTVPTATSLYTGGSLTVVPFLVFYILLYVLFRSFVFLGNRRAKQIYDRNARVMDAKFNEMTLEHQGNQPDSLAILRSPTLIQESGATSLCWLSFIRTFPLYSLRMQPSCSHQVSPFPSHFGNDMNPDFHKLNATQQTPIFQVHSSFESLISDAEFINFPFQEWASSWLSSGVESNADSISKYLWCDGESVDPEFIGLFPTNESQDVISGMHVRGPVKHIDRAIAKVEI